MGELHALRLAGTALGVAGAGTGGDRGQRRFLDEPVAAEAFGGQGTAGDELPHAAGGDAEAGGGLVGGEHLRLHDLDVLVAQRAQCLLEACGLNVRHRLACDVVGVRRVLASDEAGVGLGLALGAVAVAAVGLAAHRILRRPRRCSLHPYSTVYGSILQGIRRGNLQYWWNVFHWWLWWAMGGWRVWHGG
jgi:hypothetical protein